LLFSGKSFENVRLRRNIQLAVDPNKVKRQVAKPTFKSFDIISDDLSLIEMLRCKVTLNKPIYTGFCVLELSKHLMYDFHYNHMKRLYEHNAKLCFTDTDSLCYHVETADIYADMKSHMQLFDTSNYPVDERGLFSKENAKVVGKMKDECGGQAPRQFVGLRSKMYSLQVRRDDRKPKLTAKGINRTFVKHHLRHELYLNTLVSKGVTRANFRRFQSKRHRVHTVSIDKICLSAFDNKRYILDDGVSTLAYGHYSIPSRV
jgi:hypothetical protein